MYLLLALILNTLALIITATIVPGFQITDFQTAILAAIVLGVVNTFIKPVLIFMTAPLNFMTLGLFTFVINAIMLWLVSAIIPNQAFTIENWWTAILAAVVLSVVSTILSMVLKDLVPLKGKRR